MKPIKTKNQIRDEINQQVEEFLQSGGKVNVVKQGVSGNEDNSNLFKQAASFGPKQDRTPVTEVIKRLEERKAGSQTHRQGNKKPKKVLVTDDFGEPLRWVWKD